MRREGLARFDADFLSPLPSPLPDVDGADSANF